MKLHQVDQNSLEWLVLRSGKVTASELGNLFTPKMKPRTGEMVKTYLCEKVAERWMGGPIAGNMTLDMEFGKIREEEAIPWYQFTFNEEVQKIGFVTTDDERFGCSPDGILANQCGLEIKCPAAHNHVKWLLSGEVPEEYLPQIHGSMFVTGFPSWKFVAYRVGMPALVKVVHRDEEIMSLMREVLEDFDKQIESAIEKMAALNGGKMPARKKFEARPESKQAVNDGEIMP